MNNIDIQQMEIDEGTAVYYHADDCPGYCDFACNGNLGDQIADAYNKGQQPEPLNGLPQKPGYYWRRGPTDLGDVAEQVVEVDKLGVNDADLFYWAPGEIGGVYIKDEEGVEWAGPIPEWKHE